MPPFATLSSLMDAMYGAISGRQELDIELEMRVFAPEARLVRTGFDESGNPWRKVMDLADYRADVAPFLAANPFHEVETSRKVFRCDPYADIQSSYEARSHPDAPDILFTGVNSIHCVHNGEGWQVLNMIWSRTRQPHRIADTAFG